MRHKEVPNDYISRYEFVKHLTGVEDGWRHPFQYGELQEEVLRFPAANVVEVATTSWEDIERIGFGSWEATCKHCKRRMMYMAWWKYCPACGAKVEETQEATENG